MYVASVNPGIVTPITTATNRAGKQIPAGDYPDAIAITKNGLTAYIVDYTYAVGSSVGDVIPISTRTNQPGKAILVGGNPGAIAITP